MNVRTVFCEKLKKEAPGLTHVPYPGALGKKIFDHISIEAWQLWLKHQTLLINENRLNVLSPEARPFLENEMQKFLFEGSNEKPKGYTPV
ncbi:MAG: oxidative damage protection protein [Candidatus Berkiellales bacterium]